MTSSLKTSKWFTVVIAFIPLVMMYKVPVLGIKVPTLLTAVCMVYSIMQLIKSKIRVPVIMLLTLILYLVFVMTKSPIATALIYVSVICILCAICTGIVNVALLRKLLEMTAIVAALCVIFQQVVHIITGIHVPFLVGSLMADDMLEQYGYLVTSGIGRDDMYRPSSFFLEPSQYSQFCTIGLGSCLFSEHPQIKKAIVISMGIFACTSGLGFVSVFAIWAAWGLSREKSKAELFKKIPLILILLILAYYVLDNITFTHNIINRFTTTDSTEYNAIDGRLFWWDTYFGNFKFGDFLYGFGAESLPEDIYFTGFMTQLFCYGVIGVSLLFLFLILLIINSDIYGKVCVTLYTGLLFFANLTYYHNILFYFGVYLAFCVAYKNDKMKNTRKVINTPCYT